MTNVSENTDGEFNPSLCDVFHVTSQDLATTWAFLGFSKDDVAKWELIEPVIVQDIDQILEDFYTHLQQHDELRRFLSDEETVRRLKRMLREYLLSLGEQGKTDQIVYAESRLRIGYTHERVGLKQKWYLGAYVKLAELIANRLAASYSTDAATLVSLLMTLNRRFKFDEILAVETYYQATMQRLESSLSQLEETRHQLQELSRLDSLTRTYNRQYMMEALEMELVRSRRFEHPFALLFVDFDHFKELNDRHGHAFGDVVIQAAVGLIRNIVRPTDIFGRYGGEEFLIGLVECEQSEAVRIAERLRLKIAQHAFTRDQITESLTVSIGVALLTPQIETIERLIGSADRALYQAKRAGRNQVRVWQEILR
jgi:diguanylate cyclase (GGDEF)-like protein